MNTHFRLLSPAIALASPDIHIDSDMDYNETFSDFSLRKFAEKLAFRKIYPADMPQIWPLLLNAPGRTTDFSYGGVLMWVDYFHYEFAILNNTLFIKGRVESDISIPAFSLPIGMMPLKLSVAILREYCDINNLPLIFSAVPECAIPEFMNLQPLSITPLTDWSDYLYDATSLATLSGKKYGKKRNHINQFMAAFPDYTYSPLIAADCPEILKFMDNIDAEGDDSPMAITERRLNREMLKLIQEGDKVMNGGVLRDSDGNILAYTIGDIKGDTLFVHIEKALRDAPGTFEMINKCFAEASLAAHPELRFINREDDSGDHGLRQAKESYHPIQLLAKYNVSFS